MAMAPDGEVLAIAMFLAAIATLLLGFPVGFTLAGVAVLFAAAGSALGIQAFGRLLELPDGLIAILDNDLLLAIPLFILMGVGLERARAAEHLATALGEWMGRRRGGPGMAVLLSGFLLALSGGRAGPTLVALGLVGLPAMQRAGQDARLSAGMICAAATLGQVLAPSIALVFLADILQRASPVGAEQHLVARLFAASLLPGLLLAGLYALWLRLNAEGRGGVPPPPQPVAPTPRRRSALRRIVAILPLPLLAVAVLLPILAGLATPAEGAAIGAAGALLLAGFHRRLAGGGLSAMLRDSVKLSAMLFVILAGATLFVAVFRGLGGQALLAQALSDLPAGKAGAVVAVLAAMYLLAFLLDSLEVIFLVVPVVAAGLLSLGVDPVWLGVMMVLALQTAALSPPFGFALYYLRGVAPRALSTRRIRLGALPFVALNLLAMAIFWLSPGLLTWLPARLLGVSP